MRLFRRRRLAALLALLALACSREPEDPLVEIRQLHEQQRYAETVDPLRIIVDKDPSRLEAQFLLGSALLFSGNGGLAVWPLRVAAQAPEYAIEARMLLARAMLESRTAPDAIGVLDEVLELEPENVPALVLRIQAYQATGRNDDALRDIDRVLELDPENIPVLVPRVTALIAAEKIDEAEVAIETARERLEQTDEEVDLSIRATLCVARGMFAYEKDEPDVAEAQYESCLEEFPDLPLVVQEAAGFYHMIGQSDRGRALIEAALERTGRSAFRLALANWMRSVGRSEDEERLLREDAEQNQSVDGWFRLADFYVGRDEFDEALEAFDFALALSPDPPESLLFAYADTLVQDGQYERARKLVAGFEQSVFRDLITGRILLGEGDPRGALEAFEKGIRLWPNSPGGRFLAGQAAEQIGAFERAISEYRESVRADPAHTKAGLELAKLYLIRGLHGDALDAVQRFMQGHPNDLEGTLVAIRIAQKSKRFGVLNEGLRLLNEKPENAGIGLAEHATLIAESSPNGAALAVETIEKSPLDLTDPLNAPALRVLTSRLGELDRHADAEQRVRRALDAHPDAAAFHEIHGRVLRAMGKPREAAQAAYERALELDSKQVDALVGLAELAADASEIDAALAHYAQAAEIAPDRADAELASAKLELAAGRTDAAVERLRRLLMQHPRETGAQLELARILAERGDFESSLDYARRAEWLHAADAEATLARIEELRAQRQATPDAPAASK
ncbi:MAG TPA: tetratricopeptide repeat protein [Myxococcota bacterium]|nr:tetratricopeptide repeat protein [Myxococcota bacterium]